MNRSRDRKNLEREVYDSAEAGRESIQSARQRKFNDARMGRKGEDDRDARSEPAMKQPPDGSKTRSPVIERLNSEFLRLTPENQDRVLRAMQHRMDLDILGGDPVTAALSDILSPGAMSAFQFMQTPGTRRDWMIDRRSALESSTVGLKPTPVPGKRADPAPESDADAPPVVSVDKAGAEQKPLDDADAIQTLEERRQRKMLAAMRKGEG